MKYQLMQFHKVYDKELLTFFKKKIKAVPSSKKWTCDQLGKELSSVWPQQRRASIGGMVDIQSRYRYQDDTYLVDAGKPAKTYSSKLND